MDDGALPNVVIIGAIKCGTTSLHRYLSLHPEIAMSRKKELNFFSLPTEWTKGEAWYRRHFDPRSPVRGEASPSYADFPRFRDVPERMHRLIPGAKLIYLVRDPIDRIVAHYRHLFADRKVNGSLRETLAAQGPRLLGPCRYATQLERFLGFYSLDQILVVQQEELLAERTRVLAEVFQFLGVDTTVRSFLFRYRFHRTARKQRLSEFGVRLSRTRPLRAIDRLPESLRWYVRDVAYAPFSTRVPPPPVPDDVRRDLIDALQGETSGLRTLTGQPFQGWCV